MKLKAMYSFLSDDLAAVEEELERTVRSEYGPLGEAALHLLQAGGKRIRPVFVLLSARFGHYDFERIKHVAVALELIHMASLVHDDVIDDADVRRGRPTIKARWSNRFAMYTGDYLFARSLERMAELDSPRAHQVLAKTIVEVCRGEIEQIKDKYRFDQPLRTYLRRIRRKTALLIAASCQLGALAAGAPEAVANRLYWFGHYVGMSFQITDDILDFTGTEEQLGKPAGSDLQQGNVTLPVLYALCDEQVRAKITAVNADTDVEEMAAVLAAIKQTDAIERSYALSDRYLEKALRLLNELPANEARTLLHDLALYIGKRDY
ncbi:heptaprenyl diphosphate synthase component II [Geobacillus proteiniphilus]|uniref:Heptaprenyl diphosphate synthase component 2 n=1 Tax=Geobacillus proteiniphilus TaxID=860353 RepID=A0A1Q5T4J0_9BACL|nr:MULTISPECIES: heptaprenyl diphosphate synthase component II [Geobacillus]OKO95138.1 Heptaprenyl diphosphate synthase component II [Geobacillus proteiniphilus]OPX03153.1 heptaprenyl diphosphate synthase component II [Geobacillus sp. LEMMY01]WMJ18256.1 heptaprenyl diphosphate synthase component II [Geobacillus proteiniphilus]